MSPDSNSNDFENLWTVRDVARYLHVSRSVVYAARRDQSLPAVVIGGTIRFIPSTVRDWAIWNESNDGIKAKAGRPSAAQN